jgi:hypothetical protein
MNRFTTGEESKGETRTIHVPVKDVDESGVLDEKVRRAEARKTAEFEMLPLWRRAFAPMWAKVALAAVVLLGLSPFLMESTIESNVRKDLAAMKAMGVPLEEADHIPPEVALSENAAPVYEDAFRRLVTPGPEADALAALRKCDNFGVVRVWTTPATRGTPIQQHAAYGVLPSAPPASAAQALKTLAPLTDAIRQAATRPYSFYPANDVFQTPTKILGPFYRVPRETFRPYDFKDAAEELIMLTAIVELESGNETQGNRDLLAAAQIINQSSRKYSVMRTGDSLGPLTMFEKRCWVLAQQHANDPKMLADISVAYDSVKDNQTPLFGADYEMPEILKNWNLAVANPIDYETIYRERKSDSPPILSSNKFLMAKARSQGVREWRKLLEAIAANPHNMGAVGEAFSKAQENAINEWPLNSFLDCDFNIPSQECNNFGEEMACQNMFGQSIHLLLYRAQHGAFPAKMIAGHGFDTIDPFNGRALIYKPSGKGFKLYSVYKDLVDSGGDGLNPTGETDIIGDGKDLVITYP